MRGAMKLTAVAGGLALAIAGAAVPAAAQQKAGEAMPNTLTAEEKAAGWRLLFDGKTTAGWRGYKQQGMPEGWQVVDGALTRVGQAGDIITVDQFQDFELTLEWMVAPGGNSGIFFRASEDTDWIYQNAPEMQVLDDAAHQDGLQRETAAGSNYALHPARQGVVKPAGEWNSVRILVRGNHVEQWMNGVKVVEYELGDADWKQRVANSKFAAWPEYGTNARGHIGLQDHGDRVAFRNIKIRELK